MVEFEDYTLRTKGDERVYIDVTENRVGIAVDTGYQCTRTEMTLEQATMLSRKIAQAIRVAKEATNGER